MSKYLLRYLIFWVPGAILSLTFQNSTMVSIVLQWFFAFFFILGWAANSGMAAVRHPRKTLSFILVYAGLVTLGIVIMYSSSYHSATGATVRFITGLLSFSPLDIIIVQFIRYSIPHEIYLLGAQVAICLAGYVVGLVVRRVKGIGRHTPRYWMSR